MKCEKCKYWKAIRIEKWLDGVSGFCLRRSPSLTLGAIQKRRGYESAKAVWPVTKKSDYCYEFKEIENE